MKNLLLVVSFMGLQSFPALANEDPEQAKQEKIEWFTGVKQCAEQEKTDLTAALGNPELDSSLKQILSQIVQTSQKMVAAADSGLAAAKAGSLKAIQAAEDEYNSLRNSKEILDLKKECAGDLRELKERAASDKILTALVAKVEEEYSHLIAKEEEARALHKQSELARRQIETLKRQLRIAELEREKKALESE